MKYFHWQPYTKKGGVTLAYDIIEYPIGKGITITFSICSPNDQFERKKGRDIAKTKAFLREMEIPLHGTASNIHHRLLYALTQYAQAIWALHGHYNVH